MPSNFFAEANKYIPGGVNSPVRAFKSVGGDPIFINKAKGAKIWDEEGKSYIDYVGSYGPMILGHADPDVINAVKNASDNGLSFGAPTLLETQMAALVCERLPWIEKVRMVSSGTEAVMSAVRLARGSTGRDKLIKFAGCYHGHADSMLVKAGSGALTCGSPTSLGVPVHVAEDTYTAPYNDLETVSKIFDQIGNSIAAIIVEPVAGNMGCVPPAPGFLKGLRGLCDKHGSLLIMDEVMTGFRVGPRGAQGLYGIKGDITCLGKIIGGGMPVGAFGGKADVMDNLSPNGAVYQAGTLSGNPIAMSAGLVTLKKLNSPEFYQCIEGKLDKLINGILTAAEPHNIPIVANKVGGMFGVFFTEAPLVRNFEDVCRSDEKRFSQFFNGMLARGIYLAPSLFESGFISISHSEEDIDQTITAAKDVFKTMVSGKD